MLIGIDASRANRQRKTGTEWYSFYLIRELARLDSANQYILYTDRPLKPELSNLTDDGSLQPENYDQHGCQIIKSPHNNFKAKVLSWPFRYFWTHGRLSLEMLFRAPDVLFVPSHVLPLIHPRRSVVTIHDVGFARISRLYPRLNIGPAGRSEHRLLDWLVRLFTGGRYGANLQDYLAWSTRFSLRHASKIITVSDFSKKEIADIYKDLPPKDFEKIIAIANGYDERYFRPIDDHAAIERVLRKYGLKPPYVFYLGRLERKKNTPALVEAFGLLPSSLSGHSLVLTGSAGYGYDEVEYMISQYGLDQRVVRTGWVEESDLPCIFSAASAFVFPSRYEGFGIPLIEAMACGVPVAASNVEPVKEVVNGAALLFDPADTQAMVMAMERLLTDPGLRADLIARGLARAKDFSWRRSAAATLEVLSAA